MHRLTLCEFCAVLSADGGLPDDDVRPLVHQVMEAFWRDPTRAEAVAWGAYPYDSDPAGTAIRPLARPFTEQDCAARGDRAWLAGSLALSTPEAQAAYLLVASIAADDVTSVLEDKGLAAFDASWQELGDQLAVRLRALPEGERAARDGMVNARTNPTALCGGPTMTGRQRNKVVEARADLILADEPSVESYAAYFETQMHRGKVRRLLYSSYLWSARAGTILTGLGHTDIQ